MPCRVGIFVNPPLSTFLRMVIVGFFGRLSSSVGGPHKNRLYRSLCPVYWRLTQQIHTFHILQDQIKTHYLEWFVLHSDVTTVRIYGVVQNVSFIADQQRVWGSFHPKPEVNLVFLETITDWFDTFPSWQSAPNGSFLGFRRARFPNRLFRVELKRWKFNTIRRLGWFRPQRDYLSTNQKNTCDRNPVPYNS